MSCFGWRFRCGVLGKGSCSTHIDYTKYLGGSIIHHLMQHNYDNRELNRELNNGPVWQVWRGDHGDLPNVHRLQAPPAVSLLVNMLSCCLNLQDIHGRSPMVRRLESLVCFLSSHGACRSLEPWSSRGPCVVASFARAGPAL